MRTHAEIVMMAIQLHIISDRCSLFDRIKFYWHLGETLFIFTLHIVASDSVLNLVLQASLSSWHIQVVVKAEKVIATRMCNLY